MKVTVVVGNPKSGSRTLAAATELAELLAGSRPSTVIDLVNFGPKLLDWQDRSVSEAVEAVGGSSLLVVASPTFKGTYSGMLKLFLDRFPNDQGLRGVSTVPLMLGAASTHAMAPDLLLKPVLVELGATCPGPGLYALDTEYNQAGTLTSYVTRWGAAICRAAKENH
ncbi:NAD(P)H-dependent oxidoreductase [Rhodococcus pseudokoreensis]|uniref:NAD(P)H-dependent oxidoreductase n=1 Tax=Rhodococcus pseudokoreensis TaxID=2811421 RepID=A0A974ZZ36_9NOCA|nr:NAD(P)H-dependent oxidoreductase [Rhodococcus pseudokoreensis]QSE95471.1 NAD(P)H-dependent oxidoreductase [Rhodococcus pseudokoreensis]